MDKNEIREILEQHQLWLNNNGGKEPICVMLTYMVRTFAKLICVVLICIVLDLVVLI